MSKKKKKFGQCGVCVLTKDDTSDKVVFWCEFCQEWICTPCNTAPVKRAEAAVRSAINSICKSCTGKK